MRILIAEDDPIVQKMILATLQPLGHDMVCVKDGMEALEAFQEFQVDMLLTDLTMPVMDGLELSRQIRALTAERFVPIVMLTAARGREVLQQALEAGALEFLSKPIEPLELRSRVKALAQMVQLHSAVASAKLQADEEMALSKHMMHRLVDTELRTMPSHFRMGVVPTRRINGDASVYQRCFRGNHYGMICDATGHGLTAGITTLPAIESFLSMAQKSMPLESIYREIHRKLRKILPVGRFVCLLLLMHDPADGSLSVLNAGLPDAYLLGRDGQTRSFRSQNLPAGLQVSLTDVQLESVGVEAGDRFLGFTDGVLDEFDESVVQEKLLLPFQKVDLAIHAQAIEEALHRPERDEELRDDQTWCLWEMTRQRPIPPGEESGLRDHSSQQLSESMCIELGFEPQHTQLMEVVPHVLDFLSRQGVDGRASSILGLALTEILANAIDHGLLGLDSDLKNLGFEAYDAERRSRLATLRAGWIRVKVKILRDLYHRDIRGLEAEVEDSGSGFDWGHWLQVDPTGSTAFSGRGLFLVRNLTQDLVFNEAGNHVRFRVLV